MKKKLLGVTALLLVLLLLCACGKQKEEPSAEEPPSAPFQNVYDDGGNLLIEYLTAEDGSYNGKREFSYEDGQMKKRVYDKNDTLTHETAEEYDAQGNLLLSCEVEHISAKERKEVQCAFYENGNKKNVTTKHYFDDIALCIWTMQVYNEKQQLIRWNEYTSKGELAWHSTYEYEGSRRVKTITINENPYKREYSLAHYNESGEHVGETYYDHNDKVIREDTFEWANGNQIKSVSRQYDSQGRVFKELTTIPATEAEILSEYNYIEDEWIEYVVSHTHSFGGEQSWTDFSGYNAQGQLDYHSEYSYYGWKNYDFDFRYKNGRLDKICIPRGNIGYYVTIQQDKQGQVTGYTYYDWNNNIVQKVVFQWEDGKIVRENFSDGGYYQNRYDENGVFLGYDRYDAQGTLVETRGSDVCPLVKMLESYKPN